MVPTKKPAWIPNWRDDSAYPAKYDDWTLGQWVWAFLRRNAEYQADYERFSALPSYDEDGGKTSKWCGRTPCHDDDMAFRYCDPPALPGESWRQYWRRLDGQVNEELPLEEHLMEKWDVTSIPDPSDDEGYRIIGRVSELPPYLIKIHGPQPDGFVFPLPEPDEYEQVTLRFDLRYSIDRQLEEAKAMLQAYLEERQDLTGIGAGIERVQATGPQLRNLPVYLRAVDAHLSGGDRPELGKKIYPEKSHDALKTAVARAIQNGLGLVNGGYKDLLKFY